MHYFAALRETGENESVYNLIIRTKNRVLRMPDDNAEQTFGDPGMGCLFPVEFFIRCFLIRWRSRVVFGR